MFRKTLLSVLVSQILLVTAAIAADNIMIFDMRKNLQMDPMDIVYHDYYINAGPESGMKKGMFVSVYRLIPVYDPVQNKAQANLHVEVARIKVIHVEKNLSVGRLVGELSGEDRPTLEFESVMIGDRIDLASASLEAPKLRKKKNEERTAEPSKTPVGASTEDATPTPADPAGKTPENPAKPTAQPEKASVPADRTDMVQIPIPGNSTVSGKL